MLSRRAEATETSCQVSSIRSLTGDVSGIGSHMATSDHPASGWFTNGIQTCPSISKQWNALVLWSEKLFMPCLQWKLSDLIATAYYTEFKSSRFPTEHCNFPYRIRSKSCLSFPHEGLPTLPHACDSAMPKISVVADPCPCYFHPSFTCQTHPPRDAMTRACHIAFLRLSRGTGKSLCPHGRISLETVVLRAFSISLLPT
jgi:hypothetical protein